MVVPTELAVASQPARRRFTVIEYEAMVTTGILTEDERVELLDGLVTEMAPIGSPHAGCVNALSRLLGRQLGDTALVAVQNPVRLGRYSEPQPDLAIVRPRADAYRSAHPTPADIHLLIEVADSSLEVDRRVKLPLYAHAEIPEVWLVDLGGETIGRYADPRDGVYQRIDLVRRGETIVSVSLPILMVEVDAVLGPTLAGNP